MRKFKVVSIVLVCFFALAFTACDNGVTIGHVDGTGVGGGGGGGAGAGSGAGDGAAAFFGTWEFLEVVYMNGNPIPSPHYVFYPPANWRHIFPGSNGIFTVSSNVARLYRYWDGGLEYTVTLTGTDTARMWMVDAYPEPFDMLIRRVW